jgi:hypothetical protein
MAGKARLLLFLWVGWPVIAASNRATGRDAVPAPGVDEAHRAVHEAQLAFDRTMTLFCADAVGSWSWHMLLGSEQVEVSSRASPRQRECLHGVERFRRRFPTAKVATSYRLWPAKKIRGPLNFPSISVTGPPEPVVTGPRCGVVT